MENKYKIKFREFQNNNSIDINFVLEKLPFDKGYILTLPNFIYQKQKIFDNLRIQINENNITMIFRNDYSIDITIQNIQNIKNIQKICYIYDLPKYINANNAKWWMIMLQKKIQPNIVKLMLLFDRGIGNLVHCAINDYRFNCDLFASTIDLEYKNKIARISNIIGTKLYFVINDDVFAYDVYESNEMIHYGKYLNGELTDGCGIGKEYMQKIKLKKKLLLTLEFTFILLVLLLIYGIIQYINKL